MADEKQPCERCGEKLELDELKAGLCEHCFDKMFVPWPDRTQEQRDALRDQIKELDDAMAEIEKAREPFDRAIQAIYGVKEWLLEEHETDAADSCEGCSAVILGGELGHRSADGVSLCEECAPTWADLLEQYKSLTADGLDDPTAYADGLAAIEAHIAAGDGDKKHVWEM